jgi:predicted DCC family thiol-disulfide oxidoreductase YuxK
VSQPVIVFDAMCVLCSRHAQFVLRHDRARHFLLASMQSEAGAAIYRSLGIDSADPDTLVVVEGGRALRDSDAILAIWRALGWPWRAAGVFGIVPRGLRDPVYRWIARHRYQLFGRRETCWVPDAAQRSRIL